MLLLVFLPGTTAYRVGLRQVTVLASDMPEMWLIENPRSPAAISDRANERFMSEP